METHFRLSVYVMKVTGRDQINHLGKIYSAKKSKYQIFRGQKRKKKKNYRE